MKKLMIFIPCLIFSSWLQFQNDPAHTGKTSTVVNFFNLLWSYSVPPLSPFAGPAIKDSLVFLPTSNGLYCFSTTGESLWVVPGSFENVPAIIGDANLIVSSNVFLRAFSFSGDSLWRRNFRNQIWHPTVWDTFIFITEDERVWKLRPNGDTVWSRQCSPGFYNAAPAIDDSGRIFVVTLGSTIGWYAFRVYGFNQNGDQIFFHEEWTMSEPGGNRVTPTLIPTGVVLATYPVSGWFNGCYLVYFTGGSRRWEGTMYYSSAACDILRNRIYHVDGNVIVARDLAGNQVWRSANLGQISYSSPAVDGEGRIFIGTDMGVFYIINPDGTIYFRYDTGAGILTHPAISDGKVFIASTAGRIFCFGQGLGIKEKEKEEKNQFGIYDVLGRAVSKKQKPGVYFEINSKKIKKIIIK
jgi:outer membrane protein assembly factor BamB